MCCEGLGHSPDVSSDLSVFCSSMFPPVFQSEVMNNDVVPHSLAWRRIGTSFARTDAWAASLCQVSSIHQGSVSQSGLVVISPRSVFLTCSVQVDFPTPLELDILKNAGAMDKLQNCWSDNLQFI